MGKQVRFCMLLEDERLFLQFLGRDQGTVILASRMKEPKLHITTIEEALASLEQRSRRIKLLLWNTAFPMGEQDIRGGHLRTYRKDIEVWVETDEIDYFVDGSRAPVIEYTPSFVRSGDELVQGRIWADMYRLEGNTLIYKGEEFESWYDQIARWLRRNLKRVKGVDGYFGPQALCWYREGGKVAV